MKNAWSILITCVVWLFISCLLISFGCLSYNMLSWFVQTGKTALYWAASKGYVTIDKMLIDHGVAVDLSRDEVSNIMIFT